MKNLILKWLGLSTSYKDLRMGVVDDLREDLRLIYSNRLEILERKVWEMEHGKNSERTVIADAARNQVDAFVNNEEFLDGIVKRLRDKQL